MNYLYTNVFNAYKTPEKLEVDTTDDLINASSSLLSEIRSRLQTRDNIIDCTNAINSVERIIESNPPPHLPVYKNPPLNFFTIDEIRETYQRVSKEQEKALKQEMEIATNLSENRMRDRLFNNRRSDDDDH